MVKDEKKKEVASTGREMVLGGGFTLQPKTFEEAMQFAKLMAESQLVPTWFKGKPGDVLIAVQMGAEIDLAPMQAIQNIAVINGKPSIYGDLGKALMTRSGCRIEESDVEEIRKTNIARCTITRKDGRKTTRTFSLDDAKTAGLWGKQGPWTNYPYRQMAWRAFWFAARDAAADLLKGLAGAEEVGDYFDTTATVTTAHEEMPERKSASTAVQETPSATATQPTEKLEITIADVRAFKDSSFEVVDTEGRFYRTRDKAMAEKAKSNKGKTASMEHTGNGKREILALEIKEAVAAAS